MAMVTIHFLRIDRSVRFMLRIQKDPQDAEAPGEGGQGPKGPEEVREAAGRTCLYTPREGAGQVFCGVFEAENAKLGNNLTTRVSEGL